MKRADLQKYKYIIAYGIGQNYFHFRNRLSDISFDYVMDQRWEESKELFFDGISIIRRKDVERLDNYLIVVFPSNESIVSTVKKNYSGDVCHIFELEKLSSYVTGAQLCEKMFEDIYVDIMGNAIYYDSSIPKGIRIRFFGSNNIIKFGKNLCITNLNIYCGNNGYLEIDESATIVDAEIHVSDGRIVIGEDCMLSKGIRIRNNDNHHIFDRATGKRINNNTDVVIGNQVWIGYGVVLLPGAQIGDGSVVGENAVTSSQFPDHVIIAGSPAKVIRENICWSRDNTFYFNRDSLDECIDQNAKKYM